MISKIDHIVITTANLDTCLAFYSALGFKTLIASGRWELYSGDFKINVHLKDHELEPKAGHVQIGSGDFCLEIDCTIQKYWDMLNQNGIKIELGIVKRHGVRGEMQSIYVRDPDENLIELCSYE